MTHAVAIDNGWTSSRGITERVVEEQSEPRSPWTHPTARAQVILGNYYCQYIGDLEHSLAAIEKAVSLNQMTLTFS